MKQPVFALVDCNNFFVSCERLFRPDLTDVPVGVLSNNDGCFVSRSNEVKQLGIPMGAPYFKHEALIKKHRIRCFSANFEMYGNLSNRVVEVLKEAAPRLEIYSIDESFMELSELHISDYADWARRLAARVEKHTGIPVSIGVGPSKTLAKLACERAKKTPGMAHGHSVALDSVVTPDRYQSHLEENLRWLPLEDIWGVGRRLGPKLRARGLATAYDVTQLPDQLILDMMTIRGLRTIDELRGKSCIPLDEPSDEQERQKSIAATRSFANRVRALHELETAVASFAARASERLRRKQQLAWTVSVFVFTGPHVQRRIHLSGSKKLLLPTADTAEIIAAAHSILRDIYEPGFGYKKAGVILTDLVPDDYQQLTLQCDRPPDQLAKRDRLMRTLDEINQRYERSTIRHGSEGVFDTQRWHSRREKVSPAYLSSWSDIPVAN